MNSPAFDVGYYQNNGTLAIFLGRNGTLAKISRVTKKGEEDCLFIFQDLESYTDEDGYEVIDHVTRGVLVGSFQDGKDFLDMCRELGLIVKSRSVFVPFSNGRHVSGQIGCGGEVRHTADYFQSELRLMRWDLPSRARLLVAMSSNASA